ncbi:hypothetical protein F4802DRAFT_174791 [Xylaria palmicola]|nr:hypothetical protein F4802DRAFT_174791 [Xylaria palmicola]
MKLTAVLNLLAFSSYVIAAPVSIALDGASRRTELLINGQRQEPMLRLPTKAPTQLSNQVSEKKASKTQRINSNNTRPILSSGGAAPASSKKPARKPKSSYLASIAHHLTSKSPFSESSIVKEETRASTEDWEPEATIVEWETKASKEAYIWIPTFSADKTIHYHLVRVCTDMLVVGLALTVIAVILVIELWKPAATRLRRFRSGHGQIYLDMDDETSKGDQAPRACLPYDSIVEASVEASVESKPAGDKSETARTR